MRSVDVPTDRRPRVQVHLSYGMGPRAWKVRRRAGEVREATPYGYGLAQEWCDLRWSEDRDESLPTRFVRRGVQKILGFDLLHAWRNRSDLRAADVVWTHTEMEHLAVSVVRLLSRGSRFSLLAQSVWLWDRWDAYSVLRRAVYARLLRQNYVEIVLSDVNLVHAQASVTQRRVIRLPFGTHIGARVAERDSEVSGPARVVAAGNDRDRDWDLLRRVAGSMPDLHFDIYSHSSEAVAIMWPSNVVLHSDATTEAITRAFTLARAVAVPLRSNRHASGITVAIEAMALGVPVVATDVGGISPYIRGSGCYLVDEGDQGAFADAIRRSIAVTQDEEFRRSLRERVQERGLTQDDYVRRMVWVTLDALGIEQLPPQATDFKSVPSPDFPAPKTQ